MAAEKEIDKDAVIGQLQHENERLRERLFSRYGDASFGLDMDMVRGWLLDNYLLLAAICLVLSFLMSVADWVSERGKHHGRT